AFTAAGGRDVIADLASLATALDNNDVTTVRSSLDVIESDRQQITRVQVDAGLGIDRLNSVADVMDSAVLPVNQTASRASGADDLPSILTELSTMQSAYERSLQVTRSLLSVASSAQ